MTELRFALEADPYAKGKLRLSCYFDKGREMFGLGLRLDTVSDIGRCAQLLAMSAAWTVEVLDRWPRDEETGRVLGDFDALGAFAAGRPLFHACRQGQLPCLDSEQNWKEATT